jgi:hypothetical protein
MVVHCSRFRSCGANPMTYASLALALELDRCPFEYLCHLSFSHHLGRCSIFDRQQFFFLPFFHGFLLSFFFLIGSYRHGVVFDRRSMQGLQVNLGFAHIFSPSFHSIYQVACLANLPFYDLLQVRNLEEMTLLTCPRLLFQNLNSFVQFLLASCLKICDAVRLVWNESTLPCR